MQMRDELHRKIMESLMSGEHDENLFKDMDKMFEDAMKDSFGSSFQFSMGEASVDTEWSESADGRTLLITPKNKDQKLDINIKDDSVTIKGKTDTSDFSNAFSVPQDCDSSRVKMDQKNGKIVVFFPWKKAKALKPIPKNKQDVPI